jgi:pimeloyl-ACP methyl ester carboxylesterase
MRAQAAVAVGILLTLDVVASLAQAESSPAPRIRPAEFESWFSEASEGDLRLPEAVKKNARMFRYVFVAGFRHESLPGYFLQNEKELEAQGVASDAIEHIYPSSDRTVEENAAEVQDQFHSLAARGKQPLVVIAHSRGACDALTFALENPEFVREHVHAMFLVQGPFGGSGLADYVTGEGPPMDRRMPARQRLVARAVGSVERKALKRGKDGGLPALTRSASQDYWERMLTEYADAIPLVGARTFYITSESQPSRLRRFQKATGWYLRTYFGPNDGVVTLRDQSLPELGTVLAVVEAGHADLSNRFPSARARRKLRRALIQSILMAIAPAREDGPP